MFLGSLNQKQKELFMQLSIHATWANGVIKSEEKAMMDQYCLEMGIEYPGDKAEISMKDACVELKSISTQQELSAITFEILALFVSDQDYSEEEVVFMDEMIQLFDVEKEKVDKMLNQIKDYNKLVEEIIETVLV